MSNDLILGTAGHIDHGKTALVKALTGVDTDRLPEEKRRGITIELGFAELPLGEYRLGVVDVPGHERFVRNMLAGATGVDLALLIVAADESVKPQTHEHLDILQLLGVSAGVIALTKCDAADSAWVDLVEQEVREMVRHTFLASSPIVRTSARTGAGLNELKRALCQAADAAVARPGRAESGPFRLPIDRVFTLAGHGAVVTGSVVGGAARVGDDLEVQPGDLSVRVRGLHNHDRVADVVRRGQRAAVNLAGVRHEQLTRGQELCTPGYLRASKTLMVRLTLLPSAPRPLADRARLHVHLGAAELMAAVRLLDVEDGRLAPGSTALAQLSCNRPVAATWGQPFIVRSESPVVTIGGGHVLQPDAERIDRRDSWRIDALRRLAGGDTLEAAAAALDLRGLRSWQPLDLARWCGAADPAAVIEALAARGWLVELAVPPVRQQRISASALAQFFEQAGEVLGKLHAQAPLAGEIERAKLLARIGHLGDAELVEAALDAMVRCGRAQATDRGLALPGRGPRLSAGERTALDELVEKYRLAGLSVPTVAEVRGQMPKHQASAGKLLELAASQGRLTAISAEYYLHADTLNQVRQTLSAALAGGGMTLSGIRERLGTSRKYAVPLCEYLDRVGFTRRQGDLRVRGPNAL